MKRRNLVIAGLACLVVVVILCIRGLIVNSEWYINSQLQKLQVTNEVLEKDIRYSYRQEYEDEKLKVYISLDNMDFNLMSLYGSYAPQNEAIKFEMLDKEGYKVSECNITFGDITCSEEGYCRAKKTIRLNKRTAKEIKKISPTYNKGLTIKMSDLQKQINGMFNWF